jgi:hypothetical protein
MSSAINLINFAPRDFRGYGRKPPNPNWPNGAKIAVNFVINYEEGAENALDNGDAQAEAMLQEVGPVCSLLFSSYFRQGLENALSRKLACNCKANAIFRWRHSSNTALDVACSAF